MIWNKLSSHVVACIVALSCAGLLLNGCASDNRENADGAATHGAKAGDGYTYGTGPNKTRPYPQTEKVNINNVHGAIPKYEPLSKGGNKDYTVLGQNYMIWNNCTSYQEIGVASWYGPGFNGNKTSNGEVYNQKGYSAAHKNLPLPSYVKVTNLENGRAIVVRVNDRGPFHGSRIIDLSEGAAKALDMTKKGTARVKIELIDVRGGGNLTTSGGSGQNLVIGLIGNMIENNTSPETQAQLEKVGTIIDDIATSSRPNYQVDYQSPAVQGKPYVQIFSSVSSSRAAQARNKLSTLSTFPAIVIFEDGYYRVRTGPVRESDVDSLLYKLKRSGYPDSFIKRVP